MLESARRRSAAISNKQEQEHAWSVAFHFLQVHARSCKLKMPMIKRTRRREREKESKWGQRRDPKNHAAELSWAKICAPSSLHILNWILFRFFVPTASVIINLIIWSLPSFFLSFAFCIFIAFSWNIREYVRTPSLLACLFRSRERQPRHIWSSPSST